MVGIPHLEALDVFGMLREPSLNSLARELTESKVCICCLFCLWIQILEDFFITRHLQIALIVISVHNCPFAILDCIKWSNILVLLKNRDWLLWNVNIKS